MSSAEYLRDQAERCMRLARACASNDLAQSLMDLASDYLERAAKLAQAPVVQQQQQQQQQQAQPKKEGE
jgi:chromatin remodeling complex protein RSC6